MEIEAKRESVFLILIIKLREIGNGNEQSKYHRSGEKREKAICEDRVCAHRDVFCILLDAMLYL